MDRAHPAKTPRGRRILRWAVAMLVVLLLPCAYFFVRAVVFPPAFAVTPIQTTAAYQDPTLLEKAWALPVARAYQASLAYQRNGSTCGPTSLSDVERSWGLASDERSILAGTGKCWSGLCWGGLTLDELAAIAKQNTKHHVTVLRGLGYDEFRALLPRFNDPSRRYIANFQRGMLMGQGNGHFSPIGGYLAAEDLVFVLDVNAKWKPWLVTPSRLYAAIDTVSNDGKRGLLVLE
jgi:Phytochelatin synthase